MEENYCLGVVLAGGLSSRMGQDKALLSRIDKLANSQKSMLDFSKKLLTKVGVSNIVVSGKSHGLADKMAHMGPLGGIYSVIEKYSPKAVLVMPVDLPLMTHQCLGQLKRIGELSHKACYFSDNYLPLYLPVNAFVEQFFKDHFSQNIAANTLSKPEGKNGPSIRSLLSQLPSQSIQPSNSVSLFNANTPEQWQQAQKHLSKFSLSKVNKNYV